MSKINLLRKLITSNNLDMYIVPKNDHYFQEYSNPDRLNLISNFKGSAGMAVIGKHKNFLLVDGRYTSQAEIESGRNFKVINISKLSIKNFSKKKLRKKKIGFDPRLFTKKFLNKNFKDYCELLPIQMNLVDKIYLKKNKIKSNNFYPLKKKISGESYEIKINKIANILKRNKTDMIFISSSENIAWALNIRGWDNPNSPIPNCKMILTKQKKIYLFTDNEKDKIIKKLNIYKKIKFHNTGDFFNILNKIKGKNCQIDLDTCSLYEENLISNKFNILRKDDPIYLLKSKKNKIEVNNIKKCHIFDGIALTKFLFWIKNTKKSFDEITVAKRLESIRKKNSNYLFPSFETISGSGPNSAIIHYKANIKSNRKIKKNDIYLCDSGGQYKYGTTDVTRTICFNKQSNYIRNIFTRVLKGHIAVVTTKLEKGIAGKYLDFKARYWLKKINLDYPHGTGHGVGYFLNVHEGPQAISKFNNIDLSKGMILSNEPGYYKKNKFGIRIENLLLVEEKNNKKFFENLTLAPIDCDLINYNLLSISEKTYLKNYHKQIYNKISSFLNFKEKNWLKSLI